MKTQTSQFPVPIAIGMPKECLRNWNKNLMRKTLILVVIFSSVFSFAQRKILDSIKIQVQINTAQDTTRAFYLNELAWQYLDFSLDSSELYYKEALSLSEKINYISGIISAKNVKGLMLRMANDPDAAIKVGEEVIELRQKYGPASKLTGAYTNLGSVYIVKGDYARALKYLNKGLENAQKMNQVENQILILSNIGIVYNYSELNDLALETFQKAVAINKQLSGDAQMLQQAQLYTNIAAIYDKRGLYNEAYKYFKHSYEVYKKEEDIRDLSIVIFNLTSTTRNNKDLKSCEFFLQEMEKISKILNENEYTASYHSTLANYLLFTGRYNEALVEIDKGLALVDTVNSVQLYGILLAIKSDYYKYTKDYTKALDFSDRALAVIKQTSNQSEMATIYMGKAVII